MAQTKSLINRQSSEFEKCIKVGHGHRSDTHLETVSQSLLDLNNNTEQHLKHYMWFLLYRSFELFSKKILIFEHIFVLCIRIYTKYPEKRILFHNKTFAAQHVVNNRKTLTHSFCFIIKQL